MKIKIKTELAFSILFSINFGVILTTIFYNVYKHQWCNLPTNVILLLVSIYFIKYYLEIVLSRTERKSDILTEMAETMLTVTSDTLCYAKNLVKQTYARPKVDIDIVCEDEKYLPAYANSTDACMDLKVKIKEPNCYFLKPNETAVFSTGIKTSIPNDYMMLIFPRSSTGFKLNCMLTNTTGIIDAGYRDEIKLAITNFGSETVCLKDGQRLAQFVIIKRPYVTLNLVSDDDNFRTGDRNGGIGSTGE